MVEIGSQMAQEHSSTISVALEENEEQTISQSWGTEVASGAGVVWQFKYKIQYIYGSNQIGTQNTVLTDNRDSPPCCLPGTFADHNNPHGTTYRLTSHLKSKLMREYVRIVTYEIVSTRAH